MSAHRFRYTTDTFNRFYNNFRLSASVPSFVLVFVNKLPFFVVRRRSVSIPFFDIFFFWFPFVSRSSLLPMVAIVESIFLSPPIYNVYIVLIQIKQTILI